MAEISLGLHVGPGNSFRMNADRPFLLAIVDDHTGRQLFLGVIGDPAANPAAQESPGLLGWPTVEGSGWVNWSGLATLLDEVAGAASFMLARLRAISEASER
jgi:hypothetical protein